MTLLHYYQTIKDLIESDQFTFKVRKGNSAPSHEDCQKNAHLEAINYLLFEYMSDRKDPRKSQIFNYVCIPKGVNQGELDIDFSKWTVEEFLKEIMKIKD